MSGRRRRWVASLTVAGCLGVAAPAGAAALIPVNLAPPAISGTARDGSTLQATSGSWVVPDPSTQYRYQWQRCQGATGACSNIVGATQATYRLTSADVDHTILVSVSATGLFGQSDPVSSARTATVTANPPVLVSPPVISGTAEIARVLTTAGARWGGSGPPATTYTYAWLRCDASGAGCAAIPGASLAGYVVTVEDVGHALRVRETATNSAGTLTSTSAPTQAVPPAPPPEPVAGALELVQPLTGQTLVRPSGSSTFVPIQTLTAIPNNSDVDTSRGRATVIVATEPTGAARSTLDTSGGSFRLNQAPGPHPVTDLRLTGDLSGCGNSGPAAAADRRRAGAARRRPRRRLFASGHGSFRTTGQVASGAVRGTSWVTTDTCQGTTIQTQRGVVEVTDFVRHRVVILPAPLSYFASRNRTGG